MSRSLGVPIPAQGAEEWLRLAQVLAQHGPGPCKDDGPDLWWSSRGVNPDAEAGCQVCPARAACLAYALAADEREGVWGGTLPGGTLGAAA